MLQRAIHRRTFLAVMASAVGYAVFGANKCATVATVALRDATLWDGTGAPVRPHSTIAILRDTIIAVGTNDEVDLGRDTNVIDCGGAFVMPGLIDTHCHVTLTLVSKETLVSDWARAGVTTIRDTGTIKQGPFLIRDFAKQLEVAPRIISSGPIVTVPGGYPITRGPTIGEPVSYPISTLEDAAAAVNQIVDDGADFIKIAVETGTPNGHLLENTGSPTLNREQVRAIVTAAHARGVNVSAHVSNYSELQVALDGGVDSMAHTPLDPIPASVLDQMVARGITMTGTLNIWGGQPVVDDALRNAKNFVRAGGNLAMGTDYPFQTQAGLPIGELLMMETAGLSRPEVLLAATRNAALVCQRDDLGTIEAGKRADMIIVDENPLDDLLNLGRVSSVFQDGRRVR